MPAAGGPRALPGVPAGSSLVSEVPVNAVAPSDGGGMMESEDVVAGASGPPELAPEAAPTSALETSVPDELSAFATVGESVVAVASSDVVETALLNTGTRAIRLPSEVSEGDSEMAVSVGVGDVVAGEIEAACVDDEPASELEIAGPFPPTLELV
jgi:hypothetical protein